MLKIDNIEKKFKTKTVLNDVSLHVKNGELIHISGSNGSGKSTLFKIITGLLLPESGTVTTDKTDVIGALIENPGFLEFEDAMTNLKFLGDLNQRFDKNRVTDLMIQFDLNPKSRQAVAKYSVGMRQKLGIIQSVMENQNVILLDEPTRGLDAESVTQFIKLLQRLVSENKLVVIASHDHIDGIVYDKMMSLKDGKLLNA